MNSILVIAPPVGRDSPYTCSHVARLVTFAGALIGVATATGAFLALMGSWLNALVGASRLWLAGGVFILIALGVDSMRAKSCGTFLSSHWQVPRSWMLSRGRWFEAGFGAALGAGFVTVIPYAVFYCLGVVILCMADARFGIAMMAIYGIARCAPLILISLFGNSQERFRDHHSTRAVSKVLGLCRNRMVRSIRWFVSVAALYEIGHRAGVV